MWRSGRPCPAFPRARSPTRRSLANPPSRPFADISELDLPKGVSISFPDGNDKIMRFEIVLKPDEGLYK